MCWQRQPTGEISGDSGFTLLRWVLLFGRLSKRVTLLPLSGGRVNFYVRRFVERLIERLKTEVNALTFFFGGGTRQSAGMPSLSGRRPELFRQSVGFAGL